MSLKKSQFLILILLILSASLFAQNKNISKQLLILDDCKNNLKINLSNYEEGKYEVIYIYITLKDSTIKDIEFFAKDLTATLNTVKLDFKNKLINYKFKELMPVRICIPLFIGKINSTNISKSLEEEKIFTMLKEHNNKFNNLIYYYPLYFIQGSYSSPRRVRSTIENVKNE